MQNEFMEKAITAVVKTEPTMGLKKEELYIVWFCKTLQNWKALVSTDVASGLYWEVTYNGNKCEAYVDRYRKQFNTAISDEVLGE